MEIPTSSDRYTRVAIALHWLVAAAVIGQVIFGWFLTDVPRGSPDRGMLVNLHKSIGLTIWALVVIRLGWRLGHRPPALSTSLPRWQRIAAGVSHVALYACLFIMPLAGYLGSNFSKHGILLYGAVRIPPWGPDDKALYAIFNKIHVTTSYVLVAFVAAHIAAALYHAFRRDGVFERMWPRMGAA
jgi:cytochrome b561